MTKIHHNLPPVKDAPHFCNLEVGAMFTIPGNPTRTFRKLASRGKYSNATTCVSHPELGDGNFVDTFEVKHVVTRMVFHYD